MTQEERDDSSKIDENIAFGQLGWGGFDKVMRHLSQCNEILHLCYYVSDEKELCFPPVKKYIKHIVWNVNTCSGLFSTDIHTV